MQTQASATTSKTATTAAKNKKTALMRAVDFLAKRDHSRNELKEKLLRAGFKDDEIAAAFEKLTARGYLDDAAFCRREFNRLYAENRASLRQIYDKLRRHGFSDEEIDRCRPENADEREKSVALKILAARYGAATKEPHKMNAYLYRKGFDGDICQSAVDEFLSTEEES